MSLSSLHAHVPSPEELLGRDPEPVLGDGARRLVHGRRILVTGAGGSIGSELVRQAAKLGPAAIYLLDHDESSMHALQLELRGHGLLDDDRVVLADVRDRLRLTRLMATLRPHVVLHAAAHKHLPLLERYPAEGVKTNVLGTANVVSAAVAAGVECFVNVSTDKAARPTSVLGATKRVAESVVAAHAGRGTRLASVRFGNVLGSRGSFLPSLAFQVRAGHSVTVTDPEVTRFFMTIPEAASLVLEAAAMADRGETYVLDMGEPVRIVDLVQRYLHAVGAEDTPIVFTGLRPGEKLHEELTDDAECSRATGHPLISVMEAGEEVRSDLLARADAMFELCGSGDDRALRHALRDLLPADAVPAPAGVGRLPRPRSAHHDAGVGAAPLRVSA
ncbi:polysaccharide biosynthesis protein [Geodermatophilus sp. SYSU D00697]